MNRNEKLKTLQDALQGNASQLEQIHQQRRKDAMPCRSVSAYLSIKYCPPALMALSVRDFERFLDNDNVAIWEPLSEWLHRIKTVGPKSPYSHESAATAIDANSTEYDEVALSYIQVENRNYSRTTFKGGTIGKLRHYFSQCEQSVSSSGIILMFCSDLSSFDYLTRNLKPI
jgi:hypothetical protein